MTKSIKQQILEYLKSNGYKADSDYRGHKYTKLVCDGQPSILMGHSGAFRRGETIATSISITDQLRHALKLPAYGEAAPCETCHHSSIHQHRLDHGCYCGCKRYTAAPGWSGEAAE